MSLLTTEEIVNLWKSSPHAHTPAQFARSVEQTVIDKLTAGVEIPEPAYLADGNIGMLGENCYTADQLQAYGAAVRLQTLEDAAVVCERTKGTPDPYSGDKYEQIECANSYLDDAICVLRALKGTP